MACGAYVKGTVEFKLPTTIYVVVGGTTRNVYRPSEPYYYYDTGERVINIASIGIGGYNGGGHGVESANWRNAKGGGGATDVRLFSCPDDNPLEIRSLRSRILVAGGSGGGINTAWGGIEVGGKGNENSTGGTQTSGGNPCSWQVAGKQGGFGWGGYPLPGWYGTYGHGGGSGWYGGGGGSGPSGGIWSGAGGSSTISGAPFANFVDSQTGEHTGNNIHESGIYFTDIVTKAGNEVQPSPNGGTQTGNLNAGYLRITVIRVVHNLIFANVQNLIYTFKDNYWDSL